MVRRRAAMTFLPMLLLTALPVAAQESAEDLRRRLEALGEQVRTLQAELASLRTTLVPGAAAASSVPSEPQRATAPTPVPGSEASTGTQVNDDGTSAVVTFWPSEFTQLRAQYRRARFGEDPAANELFLQAFFTIGAHGAHPF